MNEYHGEITDHRVVKKDLPMTISTLRWGDKNNTNYNNKEHDVQMLRMLFDKINNQPRVNPQRRMAQYSRRYLPRSVKNGKGLLNPVNNLDYTQSATEPIEQYEAQQSQNPVYEANESRRNANLLTALPMKLIQSFIQNSPHLQGQLNWLIRTLHDLFRMLNNFLVQAAAVVGQPPQPQP
ncbi:hypothetical protein PV325_009928 [Microctonus aethiopoides]|uniref:Uncharacterized protein n=1 Tax=Microctonus aethiopoides TaxID=144406 RepID=A0AA39F6S7_9HYME|nr:hypothetical protein PV325_009928 [Microctonus aethiopoides]KAK0163906.1 hypothetical protein PV328_002591 [Microctonus aethiopoides]